MPAPVGSGAGAADPESAWQNAHPWCPPLSRCLRASVPAVLRTPDKDSGFTAGIGSGHNVTSDQIVGESQHRDGSRAMPAEERLRANQVAGLASGNRTDLPGGSDSSNADSSALPLGQFGSSPIVWLAKPRSPIDTRSYFAVGTPVARRPPHRSVRAR